MKINPTHKELLFVHHSISNNKPNNNKHVIALIDETTNFIYPLDLLDAQILLAIGLSHDDLSMCKEFFKS